MSIEVLLEGKLEEQKDFEGYTKLVKELAETWQLKMEIYEDFALIDVCPEGFIELSYQDTFLSISAQTNVAGPGFHAYVCDFFSAIQEISPIELQCSDPTGYAQKHDFHALTYGVFHRWLKDIGTYIEEIKEEDNELCISWPLDYYQPKPKDGYVVTPMGYISVDDFLHQDTEQLAERFFIWNHKGRDAHYYRNAALNLLWKECSFQYSNMNETTEKQANTILELLEIAHEMDPQLALPMEEYNFLCGVMNRMPKITSGKHMVLHPEIGYRKEIVAFHFGSWSIPAHGCAEKSVDDATQTLYLMAPYERADEPWRWMYKVNVYAFQQEVEEILPDIPQHPQMFDVSHDTIKGAAYIEKKEDHTLLHAQLNCGKEMMIIQIIACEEADLPLLQERIQHIKCRNIQDDAIQA